MWAKNDFFAGGDSCLRYYAYRKMIAAKMVFVRFRGGEETQIWGQLPPGPPVAMCLYEIEYY